MIATVLNESKLEERLMMPSERDLAAATQLKGDVIILGAGGQWLLGDYIGFQPTNASAPGKI